ncbi:amino acid ABC transporter substrate-binding protein [Hahella sp. CCB-MM4]|uniref:substrate-binding periplasmic protein n=1 Tax=Hahella sp. (strain CCB-MM4) TaxID=1926491 RepID=UPI000BCBED30|nr:transporter substrate-binding domain-containing protein [Hahella sp. CCB-MM4]OZG74993.1 amino acid ABC transporter substrate-binding protein [Hahella sp. CCB-MM4]
MSWPVISIAISLYLVAVSFRAASVEPQLETLVAASDPWPPYVDEMHPEMGVSVEIANAAFATQGFKVRQLMVPWARALEGTRTGTFDLILDAWWSSERAMEFMYSRPYLDGSVKLIKRRDEPFIYQGLDSLSGKQVAVVRGYAYNDEFNASPDIRRYEVVDFASAVAMLLRGRVDFAIENELVARYRLGQVAPDSLAKIEFVEPPVSVNLVYVISGYRNPRHYEIITAFNRGLEIIRNNGEYLEILKRNGLQDLEKGVR